jgi:hypothetical protein
MARSDGEEGRVLAVAMLITNLEADFLEGLRNWRIATLALAGETRESPRVRTVAIV